MASIGQDAGMARTLREQLVEAMDRSGMTRYAIAQATGIHESTLSRFTAGERGLSFESLEALWGLLALEVKQGGNAGGRRYGKR